MKLLKLNGLIFCLAAYTTCFGTTSTTEPAVDYGTVTGNITFSNNYVWRGLTQTYNMPSVQSSVTYNYHGLYFNAFGANVNFNNGGYGTLELDPSIGYTYQWDNGFGFDVGVIRYTYPRAHRLDYAEGHVSTTYKIITALVSYTNDTYATGEEGWYYSLAADYLLPIPIEGLSIGASIGRSTLPESIGGNYTDYSATITKTITKKIRVKGIWTDTNGQFANTAFGDDKLQGQIIFDL